VSDEVSLRDTESPQLIPKDTFYSDTITPIVQMQRSISGLN
jgi:hypothetical protein